MRQASRRPWRIGQTRPVKVVFMSYKNTLQADALKLVAKKLESSLAVEGELPEDGLAAYGDDGDDLMMALARKIVSGDEEEDETVEAVFAQARDAEASAEEFLAWATAGRSSKSSRRLPRPTATVTTLTPSGRRSSWSWVAATTPTATDTQPSRSTGTATATRPRSRSRRCSPGRSSWPRSRSSPRAAAARRSPQPRPCSIGRWTWRKSERRSRSACLPSYRQAQGADP